MLLEESTCRLEISENIHQLAWERSQTASPQRMRLQTYSHFASRETLLPWLREQLAGTAIAIAAPAAVPGQWEMVPGFSIDLRREGQPDLRLVCLPDESMDHSDFRVPQEWVDVSGWVGDYYLAVEVDPDEQAIEIWGYATHAQLKQQGEYDECDRTYTLSTPDFFTDLSGLWVMLQVGTEPTRSPVPALAPLAPGDRATLIQQLSQPTCHWPRLQSPVTAWNALLEQPDAFARLCQQRQQTPTAPASPSPRATPTITRLTQWFENVFESGWQALEEALGPDLQPALSLRNASAPTQQRRVKSLDLGAEQPPLWLLVLLEEDGDRFSIRMRLSSQTPDGSLPAAVALTLKSAEGEVVQSVSARPQDTSIQLKRFRCPPSTAFTVEVSLGAMTLSEAFTT